MADAPLPDMASEIAHFSKIEWCNKYIKEAGWTSGPTRSRERKESTEDSLFAIALQTPGTLVRHATICKAPSIPLPSSYKPAANQTLMIPICRTFWQLGSELNGHPHIAHGGLLATLLDEQMGILIVLNQEFGKVGEQGTQEIMDMTVYLNVRYKAPIKTPGVIMGVAECTKKEGRKTFIRAAIVDDKGVECAIAEALFIQVPEARL